MEFITHFLYDYLIKSGFSQNLAEIINLLALLIVAIFLIFIVDLISRKIILNATVRFAKRSKTKFDDLMVNNKVPRNAGHIIPYLLSLELLPKVFTDFPNGLLFVDKVLQLFAVILTLWIVRSLLNSFKDYFKTIPGLKDKPIDSYIQVFMIFVWVWGILFAFAIITDSSIWTFLTAMGAASAVLILVFKDTLLGFIASIQVSVNDMVRIGDWITFSKYGADGDVIEINLSTVKVQNFDKTITTIPTYALISESFKNWRGMEESDGRRIKRAMIFKQSAIRYLGKSEVEELMKIELISSYLEKRQADIEAYNKKNNVNKELAINGRSMTNIGVFRKYIETYAENHSAVNEKMIIMARQLDPTTQGIPIEIYAFSSDKDWKNYEYIMADIFDHLIAAVPFFHLDLFELPNNSSFKS